MIPFSGKTVTLYKRTRSEADGRTTESWSRHVIDGCSWQSAARTRISDGVTLFFTEIVCRLPASGEIPAPGDVLVCGLCTAEVSSAREASLLAQRSDAFRIASVSDNAAGPMAHIAARGELTC